MQNFELMSMLIESLNSFVGDFIVRDIEFLKVESYSAEHLLQSFVTDVIIYQIQNFEPRCEVLGNVVKSIICYLAAVQF